MKRHILFLFLCILVLSCKEDTSQLGKTNADFTPKEKAPDNALFQLIDSDKSGITFRNDIIDYPGANINRYDYYYNGGGVSLGDVNNDGLIDVFFTGNLVTNRLYLNKGDLQFEDITDSAGVADEGFWSTGSSMVDINNDGWLDIYVCHSGPSVLYKNYQNHFYINNQDGTFTDKSVEMGLSESCHSNQATFLDVDLDGDLDMFLMNHADFVNRFKDIRQQGKKEQAIRNFMRKPENQAIMNNKLFINDGLGQFANATRRANLDKWGYGLGLVASDMDKDGNVDIYVGNDYHIPDFFFRNTGNGQYIEQNNQVLGHNSQFSMGCDVSDFNNDTWPDIAVVDMTAGDRIRNKTLMASMNENRFLFITKQLGYQEQFMYNTFQLNNGNNTYSDIGQMMGATQTDWSWTSLLADFDMDGDKDYLITNGFRRDTKHRDINKESREDILEVIKDSTKNTEIEMLKNMAKLPSVPLTNYLYEHTEQYELRDASQAWGFVHPSFSNGGAYGDLDNDGDLDLVINNIDLEAFVYKNNAVEQGRGNYLKIKFDNNPKNMNAKITLYSGDQMQYQEFNPVRGYLSCMEPIVYFGLKRDTKIDSVHVEWLYAKELSLTDVEPNQVLNLTIDDSRVKDARPKVKKAHFFEAENALAMGMDYIHRENNFWDFKTEVLLPQKQSTNGPHLAVGDVNGDGRDDVYLGGAIGQTGQLFVQMVSGKFVPTSGSTFSSDTIYEDMGALFVDIDSDRDLDLYVVSGGGGDVLEEGKSAQDRLYLNNGKGMFTRVNDRLPEESSSGSRVKPCDIDGDGDLDLFVGGRVVPGQYPSPAKSQLLINNSGSFEDKIEELAPALAHIGMVTDFQWLDLNGDKAMDLVVVGEWMDIEFFEQREGKFIKVTDQYYEGDSRGWWYSIAAEDMDNDGDVDLIVGNLGLNNKFHAAPDHPFEIYLNDFDDNGTPDIVLAKTYGHEVYPVRGKDCSSTQMPFIKDKYPTYEGFAKASLIDIYSEEKITKSLHYSLTDFSSVYFENRNGKYVKHVLPKEAQFAPIQDILIDDINLDGHKDIIIAGNIFTTEIETSSYDGGEGLLLLGDGKGNFSPKRGMETGQSLNKDLRDLSWIKIKGQQYLIATNNNELPDLIKVKKRK